MGEFSLPEVIILLHTIRWKYISHFPRFDLPRTAKVGLHHLRLTSVSAIWNNKLQYIIVHIDIMMQVV